MQPDITVVLPDLRIGGAERVAVNLVNEFAARGLLTDLVLFEARGEFLGLIDSRVRIVSLAALNARSALLPLVRYFRRSSPKAILAMMWPVTSVVALARVIARVPSRLILSEHTTWSATPEYKIPVFRLLLRLSLFLSSRVANSTLCVSKAASADLEKVALLPKGSVRAIYNPVQRNAYLSTGLREVKGSIAQTSTRTILAVGNLSRMKNYPLLISAFAELIETEDARLIILGEGPERDALEQLINEKGVTGKVELRGMVLDVDEYYLQAQVLALSSDVEGFANVLVEALSHGLNVVSTDCRSGPREILCDGKYGRLVPIGSVQDYTNALREALHHPIEPTILIRRASDFSIDKIADEYISMLIPGSD